ncbi:MAG: homocysteine S-methyltransferase [Boseongicola sp.]|nr:MAG: homocysteine S-methyltransferase [Boseongicola sp.]
MTDITLLDGGMGQELLARVPDAPTGLWATQVMVDHPGLVADIHRDYFDAGATIATANTYALHHDRFTGTAQEGQLATLMQRALEEAHAAKPAIGRIAGSIGPLTWSYKAEGLPAYREARELYAEVAQHLASRTDLLICETVASVEQARASLDGARETDQPVWLSVTLDDEDGIRLRSGEHLNGLKDLDPDAWLANCSAPEAMPAALAIFATWGKPFGAYANGFKEITKAYLNPGSSTDALPKRDLGPEIYADHVLAWVESGATIVGGCCETGPAHIREIARRLTAAGHTIV